MNFAWKNALITVLLILLFVGAASMAMGAQKAGFTNEEKQAINDYYRQLLSKLAPASINRNPLPFALDQALKVGTRFPISLEKKAERLPEQLESKLPFHTDMKRYRLGNHVLLVKSSDRTIVDIIRDAGMK